MPHTLLSAVNRCFKRVRLIQGDAGALTSLTDSPRQAEIDSMVQVIQEVISDLFETCNLHTSEVSEGTFTLVASQREYDLASDFEGMAIDKIVDQTDGYDLFPYPGGFERMFRDQEQPSSYEGNPVFWVINPTTGKIRLDTNPSSGEAGRVYTYVYKKTLRYSSATDTFPFSDQVFEDLMPAIKEVWNREAKEKFDPVIYQRAMSRATQTLTQREQRNHW